MTNRFLKVLSLVLSKNALEPFYLLFQITSTPKSLQPSDVTITTSRLNETGGNEINRSLNFIDHVSVIGKYL